MCLLRRDEQDTNCGHPECKNFYMLNKQICMYNVNGTKTTENSSTPSITSQQNNASFLLNGK